MSHTCSMEFMLNDLGGQTIHWKSAECSSNETHTVVARWHGALSSIKTQSLFFVHECV